MRWSLSELRYAWKMRDPISIKDFFLGLPKRWYRRTKLIFFWLFKGYTYEAIWDLDDYFINIFIERLKMFRKMRGVGYPCCFKNEKEWNEVLERLIKGFEIMQSEELAKDYPEIKSLPRCKAVQINKFSGIVYKSNMTEEEEKTILAAAKRQQEYDEETMKLFVECFRNLWD